MEDWGTWNSSSSIVKGAFHRTRHIIRCCPSPLHWSFAVAFLVFDLVCPEPCTPNSGSPFRALSRTRDIRELSEVVPVIVDLLLNQTACGYNIIEETKRILRRGSKVIFLFHHWVRIRQTKTNFNRQFSPKQPEVGQIFILRSNFGQNKDHMTCKQVRVPLKTDIQQVRGPSKLTSSKLGGPQIKGWPNLHASGSRWLPFPAQHILSSNIHFYLQQRTHHKDKRILEIIIFVLGQGSMVTYLYHIQSVSWPKRFAPFSIWMHNSDI